MATREAGRWDGGDEGGEGGGAGGEEAGGRTAVVLAAPFALCVATGAEAARDGGKGRAIEGGYRPDFPPAGRAPSRVRNALRPDCPSAPFPGRGTVSGTSSPLPSSGSGGGGGAPRAPPSDPRGGFRLSLSQPLRRGEEDSRGSGEGGGAGRGGFTNNASSGASSGAAGDRTEGAWPEQGRAAREEQEHPPREGYAARPEQGLARGGVSNDSSVQGQAAGSQQGGAAWPRSLDGGRALPLVRGSAGVDMVAPLAKDEEPERVGESTPDVESAFVRGVDAPQSQGVGRGEDVAWVGESAAEKTSAKNAAAVATVDLPGGFFHAASRWVDMEAVGEGVEQGGRLQEAGKHVPQKSPPPKAPLPSPPHQSSHHAPAAPASAHIPPGAGSLKISPPSNGAHPLPGVEHAGGAHEAESAEIPPGVTLEGAPGGTLEGEPHVSPLAGDKAENPGGGMGGMGGMDIIPPPLRVSPLAKDKLRSTTCTSSVSPTMLDAGLTPEP